MRSSFSSTPRVLSQSEYDWAYAKRALARGDDPEEIIRRIAQFRASEKSDPVYYARLTVTKAQEDLHRKRHTADTNAADRGDDPRPTQDQREMP
jgi:hypothetical protein